MRTGEVISTIVKQHYAVRSTASNVTQVNTHGGTPKGHAYLKVQHN